MRTDVEVEQMSSEQIGQLYELLQATKEVFVEPGADSRADEKDADGTDVPFKVDGGSRR